MSKYLYNAQVPCDVDNMKQLSYMVSKQSPRQDFQIEANAMYSFQAGELIRHDIPCEGHYMNVNGQTVKMTSQRTGPMSG